LIRRVAVIVPAANEEQRISKCLAAIMTARNQLYRSSQNVRVQIFVVLDNCQDATADLAAAFGDVRPVAIAAGNVGAARRAGARAAAVGTSDHASELWLASTDADSEVTPGWLTHMVAEADRGAHMILGTVLPSPDLRPAARAQWLDRHHLRDGHPHVHGANLGIRADAYLALGGWQPLATGEDAELARLAAQAGYLRITRTASHPVMTSARQSGRAPRGFSSYLRNLGATDSRPGRKHPGRLPSPVR
jgi:cellulose synthase/poly-beta-1,6-N-acetylglucosamine synthase-like glycosyltransferase